MKHKIILAFIILLLNAACSSSNGEGNNDTNVSSPSNVTVERLGHTEVIIKWADNSNNETGFKLWLRKASDANDVKEVGLVSANITEFTLNHDIVEGESYYFGVQATSSNETNNSRIIYTLFNVINLGNDPQVSLVGNATSYSSCISASYSLSDTQGQTGLKYGLCWSESGTPTINDNIEYGPTESVSGNILQVIPNTLLDYGKTYNIRAFVSTSIGTWYSSTTSASLGTQDAAINLTWTKLAKSTLPSEGIDLYETTSNLNGKTFHAWYAKGDPNKIDFKVNVPSAAATIDDQLASFTNNCYLMVNGGYFYSGRHTGIAVLNSNASGTIPAVRGSLRTSETTEYSSMYNVTRGVFGVDASGKPGVYWAGTDSQGKVYYYDRPIPSIKGEAKYSVASSTLPWTAVEWAPKYAVSAGPVLLKDGKCPFDFTLTSKGAEYYISNYEIFPYDIYGPSVSPDRTAVGHTSDGKIIIFICDGRISSSDGATLTEVAAIMKGLGCTDAINLDGGGSTGMAIIGEHLNSLLTGSGTNTENRAVVSTIGFFKK